MSTVNKVKVNSSVYDIEDTSARTNSSQAVAQVTQKIQEIDALSAELKENVDNIVEIGTEPTSYYTQVLVDPEETVIDLSTVTIQGHALVIGLGDSNETS